MSETSAPTIPAETTVTLPDSGTVDGQPIRAGDAIGLTRGPGGKFLPRVVPQTSGAEGGAIPASAPRPAKPKARPIRVKQSAPAKQPERVAAARAKKEVLQQAEQTANAITRMLVAAVVIGVGEEARPSDRLEKEIKDPMSRILERLDDETSKTVATFADPLMLATALIAWGVQISRIMATRRAEEEAEADNKVPFRPVRKPAERMPVMPDDLKADKVDGGNGHHEDALPEEPYIPTGESISPDQISSLMGDSGG
jgi:hypothetical protein